MDNLRVDYDQLAPTYEDRYKVGSLQGIADALLNLVDRCQPHRVLEVGCGTGHWLRELRPHLAALYGIDASFGMLKAGDPGSANLAAALANSLPFRSHTFDLIFCVNAVHHFDDKHGFVNQVAELLRRPGALSIAGIDPRLIRKWYFYEYFEGTHERDLRRFPATGDIVDWMAGAGFDAIEYRVVEKRTVSLVGRSVFSDPFLKKNSNSQLALLTDAEYAVGLQRIEDAIVEAEKQGRGIHFVSELQFFMITGFVR